MATATFAAGCFWGVEARFGELPGVSSTEVGYTGGTRRASDLQAGLLRTRTGHAEAVRVEYDPEPRSPTTQLLECLLRHARPDDR